MHNLIRYWNQNRKQIIRGVVIIVFIFIIIQLINLMMRKENEDQIANAIQNNTNNVTETKTESSNTLVSDKSAVTGQEISKQDLSNATDIIYSFITYCNNQDFENAYNLLTEECKQQMFSSVDVFKKAYYDNVFNGQKKNCTIENWVNDTYKVNIKEDMLSTGKATEYSKQDYMTIKKDGEAYKLNINNYIGYTKIDKTTTRDNISMQVVGKNTYKDDEEYTIKVTNSTDSTVQLDAVSSVKTLYLEDEKGAKYSYYNHELTDQMLTVEAGQTKEIKIKFYSSYVSTKNIKYIVFSNISLKNGQLSETLEFEANV